MRVLGWNFLRAEQSEMRSKDSGWEGEEDGENILTYAICKHKISNI